MLVALVLPGPPGENMCKSGSGTDVSAFPEVTEEEAFLKCASRQKNKGLGRREGGKPAHVVELRLLSKNWDFVDRTSALWIVTAALCSLQKPIVFSSVLSEHFGEKWIKCCSFSSEKTNGKWRHLSVDLEYWSSGRHKGNFPASGWPEHHISLTGCCCNLSESQWDLRCWNIWFI